MEGLLKFLIHIDSTVLTPVKHCLSVSTLISPDVSPSFRVITLFLF